MSFRKRNVVLSSPGNSSSVSNKAEQVAPPGVRPSPLDGRLTTSTGTRSLDAVLAGHAGLPLGSLLLVEEIGTTDFAGALLRFYAAEGVVQGHHVHVLGLHEGWGRGLPGVTAAVIGSSSGNDDRKKTEDRMKIAWRYERLGEFGRGGQAHLVCRITNSASTAAADDSIKPSVFCHDFDLSKRLELPSSHTMKFIPIIPERQPGSADTLKSPFSGFLQHLTLQISIAGPSVVHRVIIPALLTPAVYPHSASNPEYVLPFLQALRALLRKYPTQVTAFVTLPLSLYPRSTGLTRWIELISDGVLELAPFPAHASSVLAASNPVPAISQEDPPQGMLKIHRTPIFHEKGGGGGEQSGQSEDMAFTLSRKKGLVIKPFSLPPVGGDLEAQNSSSDGKSRKVDIEF